MIRSQLLEAARADERIAAAAITGSAADGAEDRWSDIDLAFAVREAGFIQSVLADWTNAMHQRHEAIHHVDLSFGETTYRSFILRSGLQVDLAVSPGPEVIPLAPTFQLVFGEAAELRRVPPPPAEHLVGMAWLHALHARSSIARGRPWQAEYMISGVRDYTLALACRRHGLSTAHGRGFDSLPSDVHRRLKDSFVGKLELSELRRAFGVACSALVAEIRDVNAQLGERLGPILLELDPFVG